MAALQCEICGGKLIGKTGGIFECDSCGMQYDKTRIQEMVQEIKGTVKVEGTVEVTGSVKVDGPVKVEGAASKENLVKLAKLKLENAHIHERWRILKDSEYHPIKKLLEQALMIDPEYDEAYLYMTLLDHGMHNVEEFRESYVANQKESKSFDTFRRFAKGALAEMAEEIQQEFETTRQTKLQEEADRQAAEIKQHAANIERLSSVRKRIAPAQGLIATQGFCSYGVQTNCTVINTNEQLEFRDRQDIVAVAAGAVHTLGLCIDGTVVAAGNNYHGQCDVSDWKDIVAVAARSWHSLGLRADGTVVAAGDNKDGQCNVEDWCDIAAVATGGNYTLGLRSNGTVVATGDNSWGKCDVADWQDIVAVATGANTAFGLHSDGTVVGAGHLAKIVKNWQYIVAVAAGIHYVLGVCADGTVVAAGDNDDGQCDVEDWRDIVAVSTTDKFSLGLRANGTVVAAGRSSHGGAKVSSWKLFNSIETLEQEFARQKAEQKSALENERATLQTELASLKGLFSGKRRKEIEARLTEIETALKNL